MPESLNSIALTETPQPAVGERLDAFRYHGDDPASEVKKGLTFAELAKNAGCNPIFLAAVCYRQASATEEQAGKLLEALGLDRALVPELTGFPVKGGLMEAIPSTRCSTASTRFSRSTACRSRT